MIDFNRNDKILVIDNNMLRFHHYDLMESMLYHKSCFPRLKKEYVQYLKMSLYSQLVFLKTVNEERNILNFFTNPAPPTLSEYSFLLNRLINYSGKFTPTELYYSISRLANMKLVTVYLYQFSGDKEYNKEIVGESVIIRDDNILDKEKIVNLVTEKDINCIFCDSIDLAIELSDSLKNIMFIIPDYAYNITEYATGKYLKHLEKIIESAKQGNTYAVFDNLILQRRE